MTAEETKEWHMRAYANSVAEIEDIRKKVLAIADDLHRCAGVGGVYLQLVAIKLRAIFDNTPRPTATYSIRETTAMNADQRERLLALVERLSFCQSEYLATRTICQQISDIANETDVRCGTVSELQDVLYEAGKAGKRIRVLVDDV